jgi:hypothetical protein
MGEVHQTIGEIASKFDFRARLSLCAIAALGVTGTILIIKTADRIDGNLAAFIAGVALCVCAWTMVIGWGASSHHAELARFAAAGHERLHELIAERLAEIETIERETGNAVVVALDDLREQRRKHGSG